MSKNILTVSRTVTVKDFLLLSIKYIITHTNFIFIYLINYIYITLHNCIINNLVYKTFAKTFSFNWNHARIQI